MNTYKHRSRFILPKVKNIGKRLIIISLLFLIWYLYNYLLIFRTIKCEAVDASCPNAVTQLLTQHLGKSILLLNKKNISDQLISITHPESLSLDINFPNQLIVKLKLPPFRIPINYISVSEQILDTNQTDISYFDTLVSNANAQSKILLISGDLIEGNTPANIYILSNTDPDSQLLAKYALLIKEINTGSFIFNRGYFVANNLLLELSPQQTVIFDVTKEPSQQIKSLQQILSTATIKSSQYIDLRFNRPIVK